MLNVEIQKNQSNEVGQRQYIYSSYFPPFYKASQYNFSSALWKGTTLLDLAITFISSLRAFVKAVKYSNIQFNKLIRFN